MPETKLKCAKKILTGIARGIIVNCSFSKNVIS
jgi:hypothetical protein